MARKAQPVVVDANGLPVDLTNADMVKVYNVAGQWQVNIKTGSRGVQARLANGAPSDPKALAKKLGKGWKNVSEAGVKYLKFAHN